MHISFDFDYTLADSSTGIVICANHAFRQMGVEERSAEAIEKTIGLELKKAFIALTGTGADEGDAELFKRHFLTHAEKVMLDHIRLYDGTLDALRELKHEGHYISIVSTKEKGSIVETIERDGLVGLVDDVIGGRCVRNNKPHPEGLLLALERAGHLKEDTIFLGDSVSDAECASRANVQFIGLLSGNTSEKDLRGWGALAVLKNIGEVPAFVSSIAR